MTTLNHLTLTRISLVATLCLTAFLVAPAIARQKPEKSGDKLYTQFSLMYEKNVHRTTNYRKGILLPVNSEVLLVKKSRSKIVVALEGGQRLTIDNIEKYSGENIDGIFSRTFSPQKVDLTPFSELERSAIAAGEVKIGMSKKAVIVAIGYPPKHKTPSLESNQWRYWRNRFGTFVVHFEDGRVTRIQD